MTDDDLIQRVRELEIALAVHLDQHRVGALRIADHVHEHVHIHGHTIYEVDGLEEKVGPASAAALEKAKAVHARAAGFWNRADASEPAVVLLDDDVQRGPEVGAPRAWRYASRTALVRGARPPS